MSKKIALLLALLATTVFISGCISGGDRESTNVSISDYIPKTGLPAGFTYMATHDVKVPVGGSEMAATEGVYRYSNGEDMYIQVIENSNPKNLIDLYKSIYKEANYNPFEEISFNNHKATKVTDYIVVSGIQKPRYTIIWPTEKYMFIVGGSSDAQVIMSLATATGN